MNELKQYRSPPTPVFPVSAVRTDTVAVQAPKDPQGYDELVLELRRCQDENLTLVRKNDTLKYNFFFLEDKYKKLRAELKDVRPRAQAPRSDRKRPAFALKEEGKAEEGVEGVAELGDSAAAEAAGGADVHCASKRRSTGTLPSTAAVAAAAASSAAPSRAALAANPDARVLRRTQTAPLAQSGAPPPRVDKVTEVVRNKAERAALAGHTCDECREFYGILMQQGFIKPAELQGYLQECSRHKAKFSPDRTPSGFWDDANFSMPTPEEQQQRQCAQTHAMAMTQMHAMSQKAGNARP